MTKGQQRLQKYHQQSFAVIHTLNNRFKTYGFEQIDVPTHESYDLYTTIQGTVQRTDMVKTIDPSGEVLVLRPDVTIPIMKQVAEKRYRESTALRYFYTLKVFRHSFGQGQQKERTQIGVELLGNDSIEADAELITLAIHSLRDLKIEDFKIELGHALFLKALLEQLQLAEELYKELKQLLHSKNLIELTPFLNKYVSDESLKVSIQQIPLLYGRPEEVFKRTQSLVLTEQMKASLQYLQKLYDILIDYGVHEHIVIDLGLVNHMNYYSGIVFQGFIQTVGKTVLMGGRYDDLAKQFQTNLPAIGFALDLETLLLGLPKAQIISRRKNISITYTCKRRREAFAFAKRLRERHYEVITTATKDEIFSIQIHFNKINILVITEKETITFQSTKEVYNWLHLRRKTIDSHNPCTC